MVGSKSRVLTAAYVDDIIASGPKEAIEKFWASLTSHVTVGEITVPGRFLGRDTPFHMMGRVFSCP